MRYFTYCEPDSNGNTIHVTLSEDEIINHYYPHWSSKMIEKYGQEEFEKNWSVRDCIDDWIVVHWAWENE